MGQAVNITDKDGGRVVELDTRGNQTPSIASGDQSSLNAQKSLRVAEEFGDKAYAGEVFDVSRYDPSVAQNINTDILLRVSGDAGHVKITAVAGDDAVMHLHEGVAWSSLGTKLEQYNSNRTIGGSGDFRAYHTPTITNSGDAIEDVFLPDGKAGVIDKHLSASKQYLIRVTQLGSTAVPVGVRIRFHERS